MRRATRPIILLIVALLAATVGITAPGGSDAEALTSEIWVTRDPSTHRFVGSALSANGSIGYLVSDHQNQLRHRGRVLGTTDSGATWTIVSAIPEGSWAGVATTSNGQTVVVVGSISAGTTHQIHVSTNGGATWTNRTPGTPVAYNDVDITADGSVIVVATATGVIRSVDGGVNWAAPAAFTANPHSVTVGLHSGATVIHAGYGNTIETWTSATGTRTTHTISPAGTITDISASDSGQVVLAGARDGNATHVSSDGGATWPSVAQPGFRTGQLVTTAVSADGTVMVAATYYGGLRQSIDGGASWTDLDDSANRQWHALSLSANGRVLVSGLENQGIRMRIPTPAPIVSSLSRSESPTTGGAQLTITGQHFVDVTSVTIGGATATVSNSTSTSITVTIPQGTAGPAPVTVTTAHGTSTLSGQFVYYTPIPPSVNGHDPTTGMFTGGDEIVLTGLGLAEVTAVRIGGRDATITGASQTELTVVSPANRIGIMDIELVSPLGTLTLIDGWRSQWVPRTEAPTWSPLTSAGEPIFDWAGLSSIAPNGDGLTIAGYFTEAGGVTGADFIANWSESGVTALLGTDGGAQPAFGYWFENYFGITTMTHHGGRLWAGGDLLLGDDPTSLAVHDPAAGTWTRIIGAPDGIVLSVLPRSDGSVIVGGHLLASGQPDDELVTVWNGTSWSPIGEPVFTGDAAFTGSRAVTALAVRSNGSILAGGTFRLASTAHEAPDDLVAIWDGSAWSSALSATGAEMVTSINVAAIDGSETAVVTTCGTDEEYERFGRVILLGLGGDPRTIGRFDNCVRDATIIDGSIAIAGFFNHETSGDEDTVARGAALLTDDGWVDLAAGDGSEGPSHNEHMVIEALDDRLVIGGWTFGIGGDAEANGTAISSSVAHLTGGDDGVAATAATSETSGEAVTVTVTGSGFTPRTEATLDDRPVQGLNVLSATRLRFTTTPSAVDRTVVVFGDTSTALIRLPAPATPDTSAPTTAAPATTAPATAAPTTTAPTNPLPTAETIAALPAVTTLIPPGTVLSPGAPLTVTADGFVPGEEVWVLIASQPRLLGTATVGDDGTVTTTVSLPTDLLGEHTLIVWSPTTGRGVRQPITIEGGLLPATGNGTTPVTLVTGLVLVGAWLVLASRRRV